MDESRAVSYTHLDVYKRQVVGPVFAKAPTFDGSTHWATYIRQFEAAACLNKWTKEEKRLSLILALKRAYRRTNTESAI